MEESNGMFTGEGIWLFAILALLWGGNGMFGGGAAGRTATVEDLNNSANFTRLESQVQNNGNVIERKADGIVNGISSLGYEIAQQFGNTNQQIATGFCGTSKELLENRYLDAQNSSATNAVVVAQTQKILDKMSADKEASLTARINQLEMQQAMCGVVRYPTTTTYTAGYPFSNCGCGCGNI